MRILLILLAMTYLPLKGQIYMGMRDNTYGYVGGLINKKFDIILEHSLYSEEIAYQKVRLYVGYKHNTNNYDFAALTYLSSLWNGVYNDFGGIINCTYRVNGILSGEASLNPHYDSGNESGFYYSIGASCKIFRHIRLKSSYTTIPEYRVSEKRIRAGLSFDVGQLRVEPCLSIAAEGKSTVRSLCSFEYIF